MMVLGVSHVMRSINVRYLLMVRKTSQAANCLKSEC